MKRALIAVYDKTGIIDLARALDHEFGIEILSTGGTANHLSEAGIPVTWVEQVTGSPEMLGGRVKTLHPKIHAAILADRHDPDHMRQLEEHDIAPIDMVVVNLYPFEHTITRPECTFEEAIEMIDIGGPTMLRAAAKNHQHVVVVPDLRMAETALQMLRDKGEVSEEFRRQAARTVFETISRYDGTVAQFLARGEPDPFGDTMVPLFHRVRTTRYGENPAQSAAVYVNRHERGNEASLLTGYDPKTAVPAGDPSVAGDQMSFNNYVDGDSALSLVKELSRANLKPCAVAFIKHTNPCGCAIGDQPIDTYQRAYLGDPIAAAGGVLCMNFPVTREIAETVMNSFQNWGKAAGASFFKLDVWIATEFSKDALDIITTPTEKRKWGSQCRLLQVGPMNTKPNPTEQEFRKISGGLLVQEPDALGLNEDQWKIVTQRKPTDSERADLRFAWLVCKHTKSNAITVCKDHMLLGNGAGQMSRVKSCHLAIQLSWENGHGDHLNGAVAAGDAFFPMPDGPRNLIDAGITAIVQPGGSNRDDETVGACDEKNVAMMMTATF